MKPIYSEIYKSIIARISRDGYFIIKDIADDSGYSVTTVAAYVQAQKEKGAIAELRTCQTKGRGRKAIVYGLGHEKSVFIGVDVRAFELNMGAMDVSGKMLKEQNDKDFRLDNTYRSLEAVCSEIKRFIASSPAVDENNIAAVSVCLSGRVNSRKGTSASVFNLEETSGTSLASLMEEKLGQKVYVVNDSKAMAYGEYMTAYRDKYKDVIFVNMGWGIGMGIIIGGDIYSGKDGYSGEFGHMHAYDNNILCRCGKKGCIETEVSGLALSRQLTERISKGVTSVLGPKVRRGETLNTEDILSAIAKEDSLCIELVSHAGMELGHRLSGIMNLLNPELIIIGGSLSVIDPYYFQQYVSLGIRQYSLKLISSDVPIVKSSLGNRAAVVGSCLLARSLALEEL